MGKKKSEKREKKERLWDSIIDMVDSYKRGLIVDIDNISSKQVQLTRQDLRKINATLLMGKNTLIKAAIAYRMREPQKEDEDYEDRKDNWTPAPQLESLSKLLKGNVGVILTNGDLGDVKQVIEKHKREAPARIGTIAQDDVWIRAGSTGLDPKQTGFFQNLQINTKIFKTQIEIVNDKQIIFKGEKVDGNQASLLEKLGIRPFSYKMHVKNVYDDGAVFAPEVLEISPEYIQERLRAAIRNLTAVSLQVGIPTRASAPQSILRSFRFLASISLSTDYKFAQAEAMMNAAAAAPAAGPAPAAGEAKAEEKAEEPAEEEEVVAMGNLFGGEEEYY